MNMKRVRIFSLLLLVVGTFLLLGGAGGFVSLYMASQKYEHTTGVIRDYQTRKIYRYRKIRYESQMLISYPTDRYGDLLVTRTSYPPFRSKGDKLPVWYHPDHPREIRLPNSECMLWGLLAVAGLIGIYGGWACRKDSGTEKRNAEN